MNCIYCGKPIKDEEDKITFGASGTRGGHIPCIETQFRMNQGSKE